MRPAGMPDEPATVITGQYRDGAWSQSARRGEDAAEDLIVARAGPGGPLWSYTRLAGETIWTRWPGEGFDAAYGLASPFSVLRFHPLADEWAPGEADPLQGVTDTVVTKAQAVFTADTVQRLLRAGAFAVAADPEERSALDAQLTPLFVPQTVTYWAGAERPCASSRGDPADCLIRMASRRRGWRSSGVSGGMTILRSPLLRPRPMPMPMNQRRRINRPPPPLLRSLWIHAPTCGCAFLLCPACRLTRSR